MSPNDPAEAAPNLESILRRVRKLLAIAEDSRADPNEAAAAAQQAERIMRKYQIENADVLLAGMQSGAEFGEAGTGPGRNPFDAAARYDSSCGLIAVATAKLYDCQARLAGAKLEFCGLGMDAVLARFTYLMLVNNMAASASIWKSRNKANAAGETDYIAGYATEVCALLKAAKAEKDAELARPGGGSALIIAKGALVRQHYGDPRYSRASTGRNSAAAAAGRADGRHADVGRRGVGACASAPRIAS